MRQDSGDSPHTSYNYYCTYHSREIMARENPGDVVVWYCSKQSKSFVLDRATKIHLNIMHCNTF
jgi:hypothetical protein